MIRSWLPSESMMRHFNKIQFEEPALEDWAGFDLQRFLCDRPLAEPAVRPCTALYFHRVTNDVPQPFTNILKAEGHRKNRALARSRQSQAANLRAP